MFFFYVFLEVSQVFYDPGVFCFFNEQDKSSILVAWIESANSCVWTMKPSPQGQVDRVKC